MPSPLRPACYVGQVDSTSLSLKQIEKLLISLRQYQHYIVTLNCRMDQKHFPASDPLKAAALETEHATTKLVDLLKRLEAHKASPPY